jgi:long-chain acyl-CoA synthetase
MSPPFTVEVTSLADTPAGESPVRRLALSPHALTETPHPAVQTIYDLVQFNAKKWGDTPCFGTRKVIKIHKETTTVTKIVNGVSKSIDKKWMFWELGPFEYKSYRQVAKEGLDVGAGLVKLGLRKGDRIAIYADTSCTPELTYLT